MSHLDYCDFFEENRHTLVKFINPEAFLSQLRSARILSEADEEDITNRQVNTNKFLRTGKLLDILKTKGRDGFLHFKKLLGWECPHVFKACFIDEEPPSAPEGYQNHKYSRLSGDLNEILQSGFQQNNMRIEHNDMLHQLTNLQDVLEYAQNDNRELGNEIQRLSNFENQNRQMIEKCKELEKENKLVKEENRTFMRENINQRAKIDEQADLNISLRHKIDELERQLDCKKVDFDRLSESQIELKEIFEKERRESQRIHKQYADLRTVRSRPVNIPKNNVCGETDRNLQTKVEILKADLEAERDNNLILVGELDKARNESYLEKDAINRLMNDIFKFKNDVAKNEIWQRKAEEKNEEYFRTIQQLNRDKRKIEEEKILCQQKHWDLGEEKNTLFQKKHELERKLEKFQREYDKLKDDIMNGFTPEMRERLNTYRKQKQPPPTSSTASIDHDSITGLPKASTLPSWSGTERELTPSLSYISEPPTKDVAGVEYRPFRPTRPEIESLITQTGDSSTSDDDGEDIYVYNFQKVQLLPSMSNSSEISSESCINDHFVIATFLPENSPSRLLKIYGKNHPVLLTVRVLSAVKLGMNGDNIEIVELQVEDANLQIGDAILMIQYQAKGEDIEECFKDLTLIDACKVLEKCISSKPQKVTVYIKPGEASKKKILDQGELYVRSNITYQETSMSESLPLSEGEVVFFQRIGANGAWHVFKIDQKTGRIMKVGGFIPSMEEARKLVQSKPDSFNQALQTTNKLGLKRKPAIRSRDGKPGGCSPYTVVMPMTACTQLPVMIRGPDAIVSAILEVLKTKKAEWAKVIAERKNWIDMVREESDRHVVFPAQQQVGDCDGLSRCILINVICKPEKKNCLKKIFGADAWRSLERLESLSKDNITEKANTRNLVIDENISDCVSLQEHLYKLVENVQNSIFWHDIYL